MLFLSVFWEEGKKNMKKFLLFLLISLCVFPKNLELNLSEDFFNSFISSLGSISGKSKMDLSLVKIPYEWEISNAKIKLREGQMEFHSDFQMFIRGVSNKGRLQGLGDIRYKQEEKAFFISLNELRVLGIENIDLGEFFNPQFTLPMDIFQEQSIKIKKENEYVEIRTLVEEERILIKDGYIKVEANISFEEI